MAKQTTKCSPTQMSDSKSHSIPCNDRMAPTNMLAALRGKHVCSPSSWVSSRKCHVWTNRIASYDPIVCFFVSVCAASNWTASFISAVGSTNHAHFKPGMIFDSSKTSPTTFPKFGDFRFCKAKACEVVPTFLPDDGLQAVLLGSAVDRCGVSETKLLGVINFNSQ